MENHNNFQKYDFQFVFDIRATSRIKLIDYHSTRPWICYASHNNYISLWDYSRKICVKSFSSSLLDKEGESNRTIDI
jgi:hypothetical protein